MTTISENYPQHDYKNRKSKDGAAVKKNPTNHR
jgi:hypothetical protein